jgi:hypothetical protein
MNPMEQLQLLYSKPETLVKTYFKDKEGNPLELAEYQIELVKAVLRNEPLMTVKASRQSGKSESLAVAISLKAIFFPNEQIINISYTEPQARIIFERVKSHLIEDSQTIRDMIDLNKSPGLAKEFSKTRMSLKNGTDIRILSTGTGETGQTADSLLGFSASLLSIDEASSISNEIYNTKIFPMLGATKAGGKRKQLILSGTPQRAGTFFEDSFTDPDFYKITVNWKRAVKAGRLNEETIMKAKQNQTKSQFECWYEAEFPDQTDDSMFDKKECERNIISQDLNFYGKKILSADIARMGTDFSIYTLIDLKDEVYRMVDAQNDYHKDLMTVTGRIVALNNKHKFDVIFVDASGLGAGVFDRLREQGIEAIAVVAGSKCTTKDAEKDCLNLKSELFTRAKMLFEQDKLKILDTGTLMKELRQIRKEYTSNGQLKIIDPDKSPDYVDSLCYSLYNKSTGTFIVADFTPKGNKVILNDPFKKLEHLKATLK